MVHHFIASPKSWLAFELNILRRLDFKTIAIPFSGSPALGYNLKRHDVRILCNDPLQSAWTRLVASIQNNGEKLSDDDVNAVLEDVYVPGHKLNNPALRNWFTETDSWWFDNVRQNLDRLQSPFASAIAAGLAMSVGDYVLSFTEETRQFRQPLSNVYRRLWTLVPEPINNGQNNVCQNKHPNDFIAESFADLMFLRLPSTGIATRKKIDKAVWQEEWLKSGNDFWNDFELAGHGKLGAPVGTKSQYLQLLEQTLRISSHIKHWAIAHVEGGFVSTQDLVELISRIRRVEAIYTKDFSELCGTKAVVITA